MQAVFSFRFALNLAVSETAPAAYLVFLGPWHFSLPKSTQAGGGAAPRSGCPPQVSLPAKRKQGRAKEHPSSLPLVPQPKAHSKSLTNGRACSWGGTVMANPEGQSPRAPWQCQAPPVLGAHQGQGCRNLPARSHLYLCSPPGLPAAVVLITCERAAIFCTFSSSITLITTLNIPGARGTDYK